MNADMWDRVVLAVCMAIAVVWLWLKFGEWLT